LFRCETSRFNLFLKGLSLYPEGGSSYSLQNTVGLSLRVSPVMEDSLKH